MLGCTSAVAGDARFANFGVARRARPVEGVGFAGLAVTGHAEKSGFDGALLSAGGAVTEAEVRATLDVNHILHRPDHYCGRERVTFLGFMTSSVHGIAEPFSAFTVIRYPMFNDLAAI